MHKCTVCGDDAPMTFDEFYLCLKHWVDVMKAKGEREQKKLLTVRHAAQARFREMFPDIAVTDPVSDEHAFDPAPSDAVEPPSPPVPPKLPEPES